MTFDVRILTAALVILAVRTTFANDERGRCDYMREIPRPPTPVLPDRNFDGMSWSQRPLLPVAEREDLCMDAYTEGVFNTQLIYMEESIVGDVAIAELNYKGSLTPYVVVPFIQGTFGLLVPVIRRIPENTGPWHLVITNQQDFEANMRSYLFHVRVDDEPVTVTVSLNIINIDDNPPQIEMLGPCQIDEAGETGESECRYRVNDIDGLISTSVMRYTIQSEREDELFFEFKRQDMVPRDPFWVNMVMFIKQPLDFVANQLHIFRVTASDSLPNNHTVNMMVEVQNIESRPPTWTEIFSMQQYNEKTQRTFRVRAIDGDTGIDAPIRYRLEIPEEDKKLDLYSLDHIYGDEGRINGADLHIAAIDRDTLKREIFNLTIVAYKVAANGFIYETSHEIIIIINDINDQRPLPYKESYSITIDEEIATTLTLEDFGFHDADLGPHARYEVKLESVFPPNAHEAFYIAPTQGYQSQSFIIGTQDHHMLDYEDKNFRNKIQIKAIATDMDDNSKIGVATIDIYLTNWNDELPMFAETVQTVEFEETVGEGFPVATVRAKDIDVDDIVEHSIMGNVDYLRIDKETGEIFVARNDAFNYHRQSELFIQIRADDTLSTKLDDGRPNHTNTSQLLIKLIDINNTPPTLRLPRVSPSVEENVPEGKVIRDAELQATDPDTTADLRFEIDWDSSYASKQGRPTPAIEYHNCVRIETEYPGESRGNAIGRVVVQEIRPGVTIDYEEFEVLYLIVRVRDLNTVIGEDYDEATFTIPIIDMNDNAPLWGEGQLSQVFRVREVSASGVVIGSLIATDIDGPLYNQVRYTIAPKDDTPDGLVAIDFVTGQITVKKDEGIDADEPPRFHLYYKVYATDQCFLPEAECPPDKTINTTPGDIAIEIIDTNNKVPQLEKDRIEYEVEIYEGSPHGHHVTYLYARDRDRDLPYNNVSYQINYAVNQRLRDFFAVDLVTGEITVHYTGPDVLDRDGTEPQHRIFFNVIDNFLGTGNRNQIEDDSILIILLDINDNAPEMPDPSELSWTVSENEKAGFSIQPRILAYDRDEPGNPNSIVAYDILDLTINRDIEVPRDLFIINTIEKPRGINQTGELETTMDLKGFWGTYQIHIKAYDHGDPRLDSNETYQLVVRPFNFHNPVFVFPAPGTPIRLSRERAMVNSVLITAGAQGAALHQLTATDEDGLHAGLVTFSVVGDDTAMNYFDIWNDGENVGTLFLKQALPPGAQQFQLTLRATDAGDEPGPLYSDVTVTVVFVAQEEPVFTPNTQTVTFFEGEAGLEERHQLLAATDPKNIYCDEDVDCYDVFYSIIGGNEEGHFILNGRVISLRRPLDFSESCSHTLLVAASNTPAVITAPPVSTLTVTVHVREVNPRPRFEEPEYFAGISSTNNINDNLRTLQATHSDGLSITYAIDPTSMEADSSLQAVQDSAFNINAETGVLTLNFQPTAFMHGMFQFDVVATDTNEQTDHAAVKVYMISSQNRVYFRFRNTEQVVRDNENFIARTFTTQFEMICNIDQILPASDDTGAALETVTEVRAHFIRDNLPVPAEDIDDLRSNTPLIHTIWEIFDEVDLVLMGVHTGDSPLAGGDYALAVYILAGLAGLLAVLCLVLIIAFIMRNRALNRRIEGLTKSNSMDSGLNGVGLAVPAPGTNKHAVEGSNPIWNETIKAPDFDAISEVSNDSDLVGIEDLPQFRSDYFPPELTDSIDGESPGEVVASTRNPVANHHNNFGFNTTPFNPEFANTQLRK